jgi:hypothetical protein
MNYDPLLPGDDDQTDEQVGYGRPPRKRRFKSGHTPHNKKRKKEEGDLLDIARSIFVEPRKAHTATGKVTMITTVEGAIRLDIQRAMSGDTAALTRWVRFLMKHPKLSRGNRQEIQFFINGVLAKL